MIEKKIIDLFRHAKPKEIKSEGCFPNYFYIDKRGFRFEIRKDSQIQGYNDCCVDSYKISVFRSDKLVKRFSAPAGIFRMVGQEYSQYRRDKLKPAKEIEATKEREERELKLEKEVREHLRDVEDLERILD